MEGTIERKSQSQRSLIVLAFAALLLLTAVFVPAQAEAAIKVGYNLNARYPGSFDAALTDAKAAGATHIRIPIFGCNVGRSTSGSGWDWDPYRSIVTELQERALLADFILIGVPSEQCSGDEDTSPPDTQAEWQSWMDFAGQAFLTTYRVTSLYEVWNEPNLSQFWGGRPPDPTTYSFVSIFAHQGVQNGEQTLCSWGTCGYNPQVITAGLGSPGKACSQNSATFMCDQEYLDRVLTSPSNQPWVEAIGVHLYPPQTAGTCNGQVCTEDVALEEVKDQYDQLNTVINQSGFGNRKRIISETGVRTYSCQTDSDPNNNGVNENQQARRLVKIWGWLNGRPEVWGMLTYMLLDDPESGNCGDRGFGTMRVSAANPNPQPKYAYCALANWWGRSPPKC